MIDTSFFKCHLISFYKSNLLGYVANSCYKFLIKCMLDSVGSSHEEAYIPLSSNYCLHGISAETCSQDWDRSTEQERLGCRGDFPRYRFGDAIAPAMRWWRLPLQVFTTRAAGSSSWKSSARESRFGGAKLTQKWPFFWCHRFLALPANIKACKENDIVKIDEAWFFKSYKEQRSIPPRRARKRGDQAVRREFSREQAVFWWYETVRARSLMRSVRRMTIQRPSWSFTLTEEGIVPSSWRPGWAWSTGR